MSHIALIPARGGSKRIPGKNIRDFLGKPLIAYSIEAAKEADCFARIIVSTDSPDIKNVAEEYGAEVPFLRPDDIAGDHATSLDVIKHGLNWLGDQGSMPQLLCCIYATAPFIRSADILSGMRMLANNPEAAYAFSVTSFPFSIQRALKLAPAGLEMFQPEHMSTRSQDLEAAYHDAGQFYWGRPESFLTDIPLFSRASLPIILPRHLVCDIDSEQDWQQAELLYRAHMQGG